MQDLEKNRLSVVIITLNEEINIGRCLDSVKEIADEIIVVDSLSTDNTKKICLSYGVRFIEQPFLGYIEQKNFALSKASYENILSLDADEAISPALAAYLLNEKQKGFSHTAYRFNRLTNYCGQWLRHGAWYPDKKIRLVKAGTFHWGGENPHDKLVPLAGEVKPESVSLDILHYSYYNYSAHVAHSNKFSTIAAKVMFEKNKKSSIIKILVNPAWAFFHYYILRLGFLDGWNGYLVARMVGLTTFLKYYKLHELHRKTGN